MSFNYPRVDKTVFQERFWSPKYVADNGGIITGSPVITPQGMVCDGTTKYIEYSRTRGLMRKKGNEQYCTIIVDMTPVVGGFGIAVADETPTGASFFLGMDAQARIWGFSYAGPTPAGTSIVGTAGDLVTGQRVQAALVFAPVAGTPKGTVYRNGVQTGATMALNMGGSYSNFLGTVATPICIGARKYPGAYNPFNGTIHSVEIRKTAMTAAELVELYNAREGW